MLLQSSDECSPFFVAFVPLYLHTNNLYFGKSLSVVTNSTNYWLVTAHCYCLVPENQKPSRGDRSIDLFRHVTLGCLPAIYHVCSGKSAKGVSNWWLHPLTLMDHIDMTQSV
jgi:hypothetical protein